MVVCFRGVVDYQEAALLQERLVAGVAGGTVPETLLLLEHPPVYTVGRAGRPEHVLDPAIEPVRINRGGDVTYHGPGQLVGYPLIDLSRRGCDLHRYLRFLEEVLIAAAADFGVAAERVAGRTGVWVGGSKLASIGVGVRRWITMHGFALNVSTDLSRFSRINPCGIAGCPMTSLVELLAREVAMAEAKEQVACHFLRLAAEMLPQQSGE